MARTASGRLADGPAIRTRGLTKRYRRLRGYRDLILYPIRRPDHDAVVDLDLEIVRGELFGLLGANGAGKTTLVRMLATTLLPTAGTATVAGWDVVRDTARVRRLVGLVSGEERSFYWRLTGRQNLEFFAALYRLPRPVARTRIDALLEALALGPFADEPFQAYSTGTRHKLSIARGLLTEPQVLLLDEPTRSLDPLAAAEVRGLLRDHVVDGLGTTVMLTTHSLVEAEAVCDRMAIIRSGRLVALGTLAQLRERLGGTVACEIAVDMVPSTLVEALARLPGMRAARVEPDGIGSRIDLRLDAGADLLGAVLRTVLDAGVRVRSCTTREAGLEDVYRRAMAADHGRAEADEAADATPGTVPAGARR